MKRILIVVVLVVLVGLLAGCNGVILSPTYSQLLDQTAAWTAQAAAQAENGTLDEQQMKACLKSSADHWQKFKDARDGKAAAK